MKIQIIVCLLLNINYEKVFGKNILYLDEVLAPSHQMWNYNIVNELLKRGHNVTLVGPKTIKPIEHQNYTMIQLVDIADVDAKLDLENIQSNTFFQNLQVGYDYVKYSCDDSLASPHLKKIMDYPKDFKFDLIIVDVSLGGGCLYPFIQKFKYPSTIGVVPFLLTQYTSEAFGNAVNPSYLPHAYSSLPGDMSFLQRVANYVYLKYDEFMRTYYYKPLWTSKLRTFFGQGTKDIDSLGKHISIVLTNIMVGYHYAQPLPPNIVPVGGAHIKQKPLPEDIRVIIDNSKHGVILFALGTLVKTEQIDLKKVQMILEVLGKLNETVFWKMEADLKNVPKNVIIRKWLPQGSILAHPKTKAFISHCGGLSTIESVYHGVPIIGLPFFADQHHIGSLLTSQKIGRTLDINSMTANEFNDAIQEILHNPMYRNRVKEISAIVQDQKETPLERALFWIEWSMRHNNTEYIQPRSRYLPLFVTSSFDVYLFFLIIVTVFIFVVKQAFLFLKSFFIEKNKHPNNAKLKSN